MSYQGVKKIAVLDLYPLKYVEYNISEVISYVISVALSFRYVMVTRRNNKKMKYVLLLGLKISDPPLAAYCSRVP